MPKAFGLDFGTTNSAVACASENRVETTPVHRSVLYFEPKTATATGNDAIDRYLAADEKGRLMQSLKSFLASRLFTGTNVFGRQYSIEDLLTIFLDKNNGTGGIQHVVNDTGGSSTAANPDTPVAVVSYP